mgnify:CR=1 FL=1
MPVAGGGGCRSEGTTPLVIVSRVGCLSGIILSIDLDVMLWEPAGYREHGIPHVFHTHSSSDNSASVSLIAHVWRSLV